MSKINTEHVFTSESVGRGHPDKVCDQISDAVLDACLACDPHSRVACETLVGHNLVVNVGEVTCGGWDAIDTEGIARQVVREIGYDNEALKFWVSIHGVGWLQRVKSRSDPAGGSESRLRVGQQAEEKWVCLSVGTSP